MGNRLGTKELCNGPRKNKEGGTGSSEAQHTALRKNELMKERDALRDALPELREYGKKEDASFQVIVLVSAPKETGSGGRSLAREST